MTLAKPNSVYVTIRDAGEGKSKTLTVYGTTGASVFSQIEQVFGVRTTDAHPAPTGTVQDLRTNPIVRAG